MAGNLNIKSLVVISPRGTYIIPPSQTSLSIYESIFTPGIVCDATIVDFTDALGQMIMTGDEFLLVSLETPVSGTTIDYVFHVDNLTNVQSVGAQKVKTYTLTCVSEEAMTSKINFGKGYNDLCSNIIADIHKNYLKSGKQIITEPTVGQQNIVITPRTGFDAIRLVRTRSVSSVNKSSLYTYFETRQNNASVFKFVTIESLFKNSIVKSFRQADTQGINSKARDDDNILAYKVINQFSATEKITLGGTRNIFDLDFTTQGINSKIVNTVDTNYADGGLSTASATSNVFKLAYTSANPMLTSVFVDNFLRAKTNIPEYSPDQQAYASLMLQNSLKIRVPGDLVLTAGSMVNCTIIDKNELNIKEDPLLSGKFLVARIHHKIGRIEESPRYTCVMELLKGKYNEGV